MMAGSARLTFCVDNHLLYLDPHLVQQTPPSGDFSVDVSDVLPSFVRANLQSFSRTTVPSR